MTATPSDHSLVRAAQGGSETAFREIVERHAARLHDVVLRIVRERADAEEVVQEVFLRAWRNLPGFQFESALFTWLYRIAVNAAVDLSKRQRRRRQVSIDQGIGEDRESSLRATLQDEGEPPAAAPERGEAVAWVRAAIEALPEPFKSILVLREYGDLSYDQLAEALEIPKGTVESRLFRARMRIRDWLIEKLGEEAASTLFPEES